MAENPDVKYCPICGDFIVPLREGGTYHSRTLAEADVDGRLRENQRAIAFYCFNNEVGEVPVEIIICEQKGEN